MKKKLRMFIVQMMALIGAFGLGCKDTVTVIPPGGDLNDLETTLLSGSIGANLMPFVPPDPITCRIVLTVRNTSTSESMAGLRLPGAEVVRDTPDVRLGQIYFSTTWNGRLDPGEQDTVHLVKVLEQTPLFAPPCGTHVHLNLLLSNGAGDVRIVRIDSLFFGCVY